MNLNLTMTGTVPLINYLIMQVDSQVLVAEESLFHQLKVDKDIVIIMEQMQVFIQEDPLRNIW
jgi:hypothetical protein